MDFNESCVLFYELCGCFCEIDVIMSGRPGRFFGYGSTNAKYSLRFMICLFITE